MPNSPAFDLANHLLLIRPVIVTKSTSGATPFITVGAEPEIQNRTLVTIYDTGGPPSDPAFQRDYPRIQVRTKSARPFGYDDAYNIQQKIKDALLGMDRILISGTLYVGVWQQTDIASLSSDYNNRSILVSNYRMVREYSTPNRLPIE